MTRPLKLGKSYCVAFSSDGKRLCTVGRDVWVWDMERRRKIFRAHPCAHPSHADFSPAGDKLAIKSTSGRIVVISADSGDLVSDFSNDVDGEGSNALYSPCGEYIVDGTWSGRLSARSADSAARQFVIDFPGEMIQAVHRSTGGERWVIEHGPTATTQDQPPPSGYFSVWPWPFRTGHYQLSPIRVPFVRGSALTPDGRFIAVAHGAPPSTMSVFDLASGACVGRVEAQAGSTGSALAWSPNADRIAWVQDGVVRLYRFPSLELSHEALLEYASDVAFSPNGSFLALGSWTTGWLVPKETVDMTPNILLNATARSRARAKFGGG